MTVYGEMPTPASVLLPTTRLLLLLVGNAFTCEKMLNKQILEMAKLTKEMD